MKKAFLGVAFALGLFVAVMSGDSASNNSDVAVSATTQQVPVVAFEAGPGPMNVAPVYTYRG